MQAQLADAEIFRQQMNAFVEEGAIQVDDSNKIRIVDNPLERMQRKS